MLNYIYVNNNIFYLLEALPEDGDYVAASYAAMHQAAFGHVGGEPCAAGASFANAGAPSLYKRV